MSSHQSQVPKPVLDYFGGQVLSYETHPVITATFVEGNGWKRYNHKKRVSVSWCRKLKAQGVTHVALTTLGRTADFSIAEIVRSAR